MKILNNLTESKSHLRDSVTDFAMEMFKKRGIKGVTMDEIASSMGISKRTLYEMFENKEELLVNGLLRNRKRDEGIMSDIMKQKLNVMDMTLVRFKYVVDEHKSICPQFFLEINKYPKVLETIEEFKKKDGENAMEYYRLGVKEGLFRDDLNYEILDLIVTNQFNFLFTSDLFLRFDFENIYRTLLFTYLRGIATFKGQEVLEKFINEYNSKI